MKLYLLIILFTLLLLGCHKEQSSTDNFQNDTIWFYSNHTFRQLSMCPENTTFQQIPCDCCNLSSGSCCMKLCFKCVENNIIYPLNNTNYSLGSNEIGSDNSLQNYTTMLQLENGTLIPFNVSDLSINPNFNSLYWDSLYFGNYPETIDEISIDMETNFTYFNDELVSNNSRFGALIIDSFNSIQNNCKRWK